MGKILIAIAEPIKSRPILSSSEISGIRGPMICKDTNDTSNWKKPNTSILFCLILLIVLFAIVKLLKINNLNILILRHK
jgi:hypothetical protein